jgi:phosphomannomutase
MKKEVFVFDIDGTLTDSRKPIDSEFESYMMDFVENNDVYFVTGSDRQKTFEQIGPNLYESVKGIWHCNGNEYWEKNRRVRKNDYTPDYEFKHYLTQFVHRSKYPIKAGDHLEMRTGMINFSVVGRNANEVQRQQYYEWDSRNKERHQIVEDINRLYPAVHASIGGQISIDIIPRGNDKSQVAKILNKEYEFIHFFGDRMAYGGNDYPLALTIDLGKMGWNYPVESWQETWERLKEL